MINMKRYARTRMKYNSSKKNNKKGSHRQLRRKEQNVNKLYEDAQRDADLFDHWGEQNT